MYFLSNAQYLIYMDIMNIEHKFIITCAIYINNPAYVHREEIQTHTKKQVKKIAMSRASIGCIPF